MIHVADSQKARHWLMALHHLVPVQLAATPTATWKHETRRRPSVWQRLKSPSRRVKGFVPRCAGKIPAHRLPENIEPKSREKLNVVINTHPAAREAQEAIMGSAATHIMRVGPTSPNSTCDGDQLYSGIVNDKCTSIVRLAEPKRQMAPKVTGETCLTHRKLDFADKLTEPRSLTPQRNLLATPKITADNWSPSLMHSKVHSCSCSNLATKITDADRGPDPIRPRPRSASPIAPKISYRPNRKHHGASGLPSQTILDKYRSFGDVNKRMSRSAVLPHGLW